MGEIMSSKEDLTKDSSKRFYISIAKKSYKKINDIIDILRNKKDFVFVQDDYILEKHNNVITYDGYVVKHYSGDYLSISVKREISEKTLSITLDRGKAGFDLATGERYDRKLSRVSYQYDGKEIEIISAKDEQDLAFEEEKQKRIINERVKKISLQNKKGNFV